MIDTRTDCLQYRVSVVECTERISSFLIKIDSFAVAGNVRVHEEASETSLSIPEVQKIGGVLTQEDVRSVYHKITRFENAVPGPA